MATTPKTVTVTAPAMLDVPVTVTVGGTVTSLGTVRIPTPVRVGAVRAAIANLFATAARVVQHDAERWPRQCWWVGDSVPLPGSADRGVVVQVDRKTKRYLVDTGKTKPVPVHWSDVDPMASSSSITLGALVAAVESYGRGRE